MYQKIIILLITSIFSFTNAQYLTSKLAKDEYKKVLIDKEDIFFYSSQYFLESLKTNSRENYKSEIIRNTIEFKSYKNLNSDKTILKIAHFNEKAEYSTLYFVLSNFDCINKSLDVDIAENVNISTGYKTILETPKEYIPKSKKLIDDTLSNVIFMKCNEEKNKK